MLKCRVTGILLATSLFLTGLPFGNTATAQPSNLRSQESSLEITQTKDGFTGKYKKDKKDGKGKQEALLHMTRKKKVKAKTSNNPNIKRRTGTAKAEINAQSQNAEEVVYYYSDSEMISNDGSRFAEAVYEFDQGSGLDRLDVTLGEVTISFDLATETTLPISEQDQAKLQQYAQSQDLQLVQDVSIALLQNQEQFADLELLFGFLAIAMLVDPADHVPLEETTPEETVSKANLPKRVT